MRVTMSNEGLPLPLWERSPEGRVRGSNDAQEPTLNPQENKGRL